MDKFMACLHPKVREKVDFEIPENYNGAVAIARAKSRKIKQGMMGYEQSSSSQGEEDQTSKERAEEELGSCLAIVIIAAKVTTHRIAHIHQGKEEVCIHSSEEEEDKGNSTGKESSSLTIPYLLPLEWSTSASTRLPRDKTRVHTVGNLALRVGSPAVVLPRVDALIEKKMQDVKVKVMGVECLIDFFVMKAGDNAYPIILGRPSLLAMGAKQDWEKGVLTLFDKENDRQVMLDLRTRESFSHPMAKDEGDDSTTSYEYETESTYDEGYTDTEEGKSDGDLLHVDANLFGVTIDNYIPKEGMQAQVFPLDAQEVRDMLGEDLTKQEKEGYVKLCASYPNLFATEYKDLRGAKEVEHRIILKEGHKPKAQKLRRLGHERYSIMDGFFGYFQIVITLEDQLKTTSISPWGCFPYRRMPFGLNGIEADPEKVKALVLMEPPKSATGGLSKKPEAGSLYKIHKAHSEGRCSFGYQTTLRAMTGGSKIKKLTS
ncbi:hypothetical protein GOP47_0023749 [Adiantum capillus-veneris]|uniref:Uncharacterized protein n=1 Tax=Adiantum capillus-veneris TaxID=13818 RepID=A0A9D4U694_ADICA|nr:hypothetical protein GOP47_0023749 [Adiantum capillus-veneris]